MSKLIDLTGQKFNKLTVLKRLEGVSPVTQICKCDCGNICNVRSNNLKNGHTKSCGCLQKEKTKLMGQQQINDLTGQQFKYLKVLKRGNSKLGSNQRQICQCECGTIKEIAGADLVTGKTVSCGCKRTLLSSQANTIPMIGKKFGKLLVIEPQGKSSDGSINYLCQCDCGNKKIINGVNLRKGVTTSCGCINYSIGEKNIKNILDKNNIKYIQEFNVPTLNNKRFDFVILNNNQQIIRIIEFDGRQHYFSYDSKEQEQQCPLKLRQQRDQEKNQQAKEHNIPLVRIPYQERDNITLEIIMGDKYIIK